MNKAEEPRHCSELVQESGAYNPDATHRCRNKPSVFENGEWKCKRHTEGAKDAASERRVKRMVEKRIGKQTTPEPATPDGIEDRARAFLRACGLTIPNIIEQQIPFLYNFTRQEILIATQSLKAENEGLRAKLEKAKAVIRHYADVGQWCVIEKGDTNLDWYQGDNVDAHGFDKAQAYLAEGGENGDKK